MAARLTKPVAFLNLLAVLAAIILVSQTALAQNFITVDYPGGTYTSVRQINNHGVMAGRYIDTQGVYHGFVLQNGVFTNVNFPAAQGTAVWGINDNGDLVGRYLDAEGITDHGFLLSNGVYTTIDPPNSTLTYALGINSVGQIVGYYEDAAEHTHGFLLSAGVYSTIDFLASSATAIFKVNNVGTMVGLYDDASGNEHGFLLQNGTVTAINYPEAFLTDAFGINNGGQIVGGYEATETSNDLGFEDNKGTFATINFPAAVEGLAVLDINDADQLVGEYYDDEGLTHGFVTATGPYAYVANQGSNTVSVIDIPSELPVATIPVGSEPHGVAISPDGTQVYVSNIQDNDVSVIDTATNSVIATIPVQSSPHGLVFTPDGTSVYVSNSDSHSVSVINTALQTVVANVPVQFGPDSVSMALTSSGTFAYVTNFASNTVSVIAVGAMPTVVQTINVGNSPNSVRVAPNNSLAYVENGGSNNVSVISVATNTVTATIPVGLDPYGIAFSPDSSTAYVANVDSNTVSVIDTASSSVVNTIAGFNTPLSIALTTDGSAGYVTNQSANNVAVFAASTNAINSAIPVGTSPANIRIASNPPTSQTITQPLNPTQPNQFNFGPHNFTVQYPPGTSFSGVNMSVTAAQTPQATFQQRVSGTKFANATCIVYSGAGGNCVDYQVTCSNGSGASIPCPSEPTPDIQVKTSYDTLQAIINPGFLTAPIGTNELENIFSAFYLQRIDPTTIGRTTGFSEFYAVDLGASNELGAGIFTFLPPLAPTNSRVFGSGVTVPVAFQLSSITKPTHPITDAVAGITVVMVANANGSPESKIVLDVKNAFQYGSGGYLYQMNTTGYAAGTYVLTVYGNGFAAQQVEFSIQKRAAATCGINSSVQNFSAGQPITFTASVDPVPPATGVPTGSITFVDSGYSQSVLGTAPLVGGSASITAVLPEPSPPRQFIEAVYSGDNNFNVCDSGYITENYTQSYDY